MGKYSSDSENEKHGTKNAKIKGRRRSSSSDSSNSRSKRRSKKSNRKSRSRSRDKYSKLGRSRSSSSSTYRPSKSKSYRDKSRHRDRRRSTSRSKNRSRRSSSRSYIKEYTSKPRRRSSSSPSSSSSDRSKKTSKTTIIKSTTTRITASQTIKVRNNSPDCVVINSEILEQINEDKFTPKQFVSKTKVPDNIVIDLKKNTIKVPEVEPLEPDSIFHHNLFLNEEARLEKWIKELYSYRQKALQQGLRNNC